MYESDDTARIYFHGVPGGPGETMAVSSGASMFEHRHYAPNRNQINKGACLTKHFDLLALDIGNRFPRTPIRFVGFSLGAYVALEVAHRMGPHVTSIDLVSAAAPLTTGDYLSGMAGESVFRSARRSEVILQAMVALQSLAVRVWPTLLFKELFRTAQGADRALANKLEFRAAIVRTLKDCFAGDTLNYRRELAGYVRDWSAILPQIKQPVALWHGDVDNWAPPAMAHALSRLLPNVTAVHMLKDQSHYSTLQTYLSQVDRDGRSRSSGFEGSASAL